MWREVPLQDSLLTGDDIYLLTLHFCAYSFYRNSKHFVSECKSVSESKCNSESCRKRRRVQRKGDNVAKLAVVVLSVPLCDRHFHLWPVESGDEDCEVAVVVFQLVGFSLISLWLLAVVVFRLQYHRERDVIVGMCTWSLCTGPDHKHVL